MSKTAYEQLAQAISSKASTLTETERNGLKALLDGFNQVSQPTFPSFTVTVNYDQSVEQLIKEGKYGWKNDDITSKNFPSSEMGQLGVTIYLVNFDHDISSEDAIKEMDKQGLRPATLKELLALGSQHPDLQRCNWIVALGSTWRCSDGRVLVPYLDGGGAYRRLYLFWWRGGWVSNWQFAAVRK